MPLRNVDRQSLLDVKESSGTGFYRLLQRRMDYTQSPAPQSVYSFFCTSIQGEEVPLADFRGSVLLIVNTASFCGFTPQFKGLQYLYDRYKDDGFAVLGFPCNQFVSQEPRSNQKISEFCIRNYGVTFPMFDRVKVNGKDADPLFRYLKAKAPGFLGVQTVKWNFTKFLVSRNGQAVVRFGPATFPRRIARHIERLL